MNARATIKSRHLVPLAILLLAILVLLPSLAYGADRAQSVSGEISRTQLRPGLDSYVSDEALSVASSTDLAGARAIWQDDDAFVDQVDYQLTFRRQVDFMSSDAEHLAVILGERRDSHLVMSMSLYMTDEEESEMLRRDKRGDSFDDIIKAVSGIDESKIPEGSQAEFGPLFAGITMDQLNGGQVVLAVTSKDAANSDALRRLLDDPKKLTVLVQKYSFDETNRMRDVLVKDFQAAGVEHDVAIVWTEAGRTIEVRTPDPSSGSKVIGVDVPLDAYSIVAGSGMIEAGAPRTTHSLADQQPGIRIEDVQNGPDAGMCTWGFNGHTNAHNYIITAGHCLGDDDNYPGQYAGNDVDIRQNGQSSRDLTSNPYVYSKNTATWDVARVSSTFADDNCYHGNNSLSSPAPHCGWPIAKRALHNSWEPDVDRTCASLSNSNVYRCGYIREENANGGNRVRVDIVAILGDSGSGMKWDYRADGILTDISTSQLFFQTAYHVQYTMGNGYFYLNCHSPGKKVNTNPSNWGTCPSQNA